MRLFFGLPLPPRGRELAAELRSRLGEGREGLVWLPPESLHLTLIFLGELGAEGEAAARRALEALAGQPGSRRAPLFGPRALALLPDARRPRVLAFLDPLAPGLGELHASLCRHLASTAREAGLPPLNDEWPDAEGPGSRPRRPFLAHCSLARIRAGVDRRHPFATGELETRGRSLFESFPHLARDMVLDRLLLYESRPGKGGPNYRPRAELRLVPEDC